MVNTNPVIGLCLPEWVLPRDPFAPGFVTIAHPVPDPVQLSTSAPTLSPPEVHLLTADSITCIRDRRVVVSLARLTLAEGECIELRGANGSGKTTLLRALCGLLPCEGKVQCHVRIAFVGHRNGNAGLLTPIENLRWHRQLQDAPVDDEQLLDALARVGLLRAAGKPVQQLSQGQQRRLALARLLLSDAKVWLLDEPHAALDVAASALLDELLNTHCQEGGAVLVSSHAPLAVATRVIDLSTDDLSADHRSADSAQAAA